AELHFRCWHRHVVRTRYRRVLVAACGEHKLQRKRSGGRSETGRSPLPRHSALIGQPALYRDVAGQQGSAYRPGWLQSDGFLETFHVPPADQVAGVVLTAQRAGLPIACRLTQQRPTRLRAARERRTRGLTALPPPVRMP